MRPPVSHEVIISPIVATITTTGLKVYAQLDDRPHPKEIEVTNEEPRDREHRPPPIPRRLELHHHPFNHRILSLRARTSV